MIPNTINTLAGLALMYATVLHPTWAGRQYLPFGAFALVILVMALWARRSDAHRWFSSVNVVLAIALGVLSLLPLPTLPNLTFWGGFWVAALVPTIALWAALYRPKRVEALTIERAGPTPSPAAGAPVAGAAAAGGGAGFTGTAGSASSATRTDSAVRSVSS